MRRVALGLGVLLFLSYAYFMPGPQWNELSRFNLVRSLVERGRIDIDPYALNTEDRSTRGGHSYSDKAPGAAFLAAPAYAVYLLGLHLLGAERPESLTETQLRARLGEPPRPRSPGERERSFFNTAFRRGVYVCNLATNALAGAVSGVLLFLMLVRTPGVTGGPGGALLASLSLSLGSITFAYSTVFFGHVLAGAFLLGAFAILGPFFRAQDVASPGTAAPPAPSGTLAAGALAGLAVLTELPAVLGVVALGLYLLSLGRGAGLTRGRAAAQVGLLALGALPALSLLAAYHWAAFGGPLATGYAHLANPRFAAGMSQGVLGVGWPRPGVIGALLVGGSRGLLLIAPVLALGFVGLVRAIAGQTASPGRREPVLAAGVVLAFLLLCAGYFMWWGGAALGPRHLVPALPFLCFGIPFASPRPAWLLGVGVPLLVLSAANLLGALAVSIFVPPDVNVLLEHVWPNLVAGRVGIHSGTTNVGRLLGLPGAASLLPLLAIWAVAMAVLIPAVRRLPARPGAP